MSFFSLRLLALAFMAFTTLSLNNLATVSLAVFAATASPATSFAALADGPPKAACPPQPGASELTFARIMMNFGRMTMKADSWTREMSQTGASRETPQAAVYDLAIAVACSEIAVEAAQAATTGDLSPDVAILMPSGIKKLSGEALTQYIIRYERMMFGFHNMLETYLAQIESADFVAGYATSQKIRKFTDHAHEKLNTSTFCEKALSRN